MATTLPTSFNQKKEITRVLNIPKNLHWEVLRLPLKFTENDITQNYRQISLLIHPDKAPDDMKEESKVAYAAVNEAKEILTKQDGIKYWQQIIKHAIADAKKEKIPALTKTKQDTLKKNNVKGWENAIFTPEEFEKLTNYEQLVTDQIRFNVAVDEFKKQQMARHRQEGVNDLIKEEEDRIKRQATAERNVEEFEQKQTERASNWRNFQSKRNRATTNLKMAQLMGPSQDLTQQYKQIEARLKSSDASKQVPDGF